MFFSVPRKKRAGLISKLGVESMVPVVVMAVTLSFGAETADAIQADISQVNEERKYSSRSRSKLRQFESQRRDWLKRKQQQQAAAKRALEALEATES